MTSPKTNEQLTEELDEHLKEYALHREEYLQRQAHQDEAHEANMKAIRDLTDATKGLVDAWQTANNIQKFLVWLSKFALLGGLAAYISTRLGIKIP